MSYAPRRGAISGVFFSGLPALEAAPGGPATLYVSTLKVPCPRHGGRGGGWGCRGGCGREPGQRHQSRGGGAVPADGLRAAWGLLVGDVPSIFGSWTCQSAGSQRTTVARPAPIHHPRATRRSHRSRSVCPPPTCPTGATMSGHHHPDHPHHGHGARTCRRASTTRCPTRPCSPQELSRRSILRRAGLLGAGLAAGSVARGSTAGRRPRPARGAPDERRRGGFLWLAGDHHIHTQYSSDGMYRVIDQVRQGARYGLDWMVITDHGSVDPRQDRRGQGQPGHPGGPRASSRTPWSSRAWSGTSRPPSTARSSSHPGSNEVAVLKQFENGYDGSRQRRRRDHARPTRRSRIAGIDFLGQQVDSAAGRGRAVPRQPPGPQGHRLARTRSAAGATPTRGSRSAWRARPVTRRPACPRPIGPGRARGFYDNAPARRTRSPATRGELPHLGRLRLDDRDRRRPVGQPARRGQAVVDHRQLRLAHDLDTRPTAARRAEQATSTANGRYMRPGATAARSTAPRATSGPASTAARTSAPTARLPRGDGRACAPAASGSTTARWSRASTSQVREAGDQRHGEPLGGALITSAAARAVELVDHGSPRRRVPNWAQFVPTLARVDVIQGAVTGAVADTDTFTAPEHQGRQVLRGHRGQHAARSS